VGFFARLGPNPARWLARPVELISEERFRLMRAGVSFRDWQVMARWQVQDFTLRHKAVTEKTLKGIQEDKSGLSGAISAVVSRILGI
jgi:hypothetical protein